MNKKSEHTLHCSYYQALVDRSSTWFVVAVLKSFEHMSFDRTLDIEKGLFEFFVPSSTEKYFLTIMEYLTAQGYVHDLKKLPNRLLDPAQKL